MKKTIDFLAEFEKTERQLVQSKSIEEMRYLCREDDFYNAKLPRILVIGKFKSGKSTLINALVGKKVAAVDSLEKTAWVARYWPAEKDFCYITKKDGSRINLSLEEFIENTEEDAYSREFLNEIDRVDVGCAFSRNSFALIDSPGFGSTNKENEKRAMDSLKDADLILYSVDVNSIGGLRESAVINEIRKSGVPMVCVGTQYDGGIVKRKSVSEMKEMVSQYTEFALEEIYVVSAEDYMENGHGAGMDELIEFCKNVSIHNIMYRENAASARRYRVNNTLIHRVEDLQKELVQIRRAKEEFLREYDYARGRVRTELSMYLREYVSRTLYAEYKDQLVNMVSLINKNNLGENGIQILQNMVPAGYMDKYWNTLTEEMLRKMHELWNERFALQDSKIMELKDAFKGSVALSNMDVAHMNQFLQMGYNKEMSENGMKLSFGVAGLVSVYEAILGANAATVALSGALVSTGLPIMLIGCGLTAYWASKQQEEAKVSDSEVRYAIEQNIKQFAECVIEKCMGKMEDVDNSLKVIYVDYYDKEMKKSLPAKNNLQGFIDICDETILRLSKENENLVYYDPDGNAAVNKLNQMKEKMRRLEHTMEGLYQEINRYHNELEGAQEELDLANEKLKSADEYAKKMQQRLNEEREKLQKTNGEVRYYQDEIEKWKIRSSNTRKEINGLKKQLVESDNRKQELLVQITALEETGGVDKTQIEKLKKDLEREKINSLGIQNKLEKNEGKYAIATQQLEEAEDAKRRAEKAQKEAEKKAETAEKQVKKAQKDLEKVQKEEKKLKEKNEELEQQLKSSRTEESALRIQLKDLQKKYDQNTYHPTTLFLEKMQRIEADFKELLEDKNATLYLDKETHDNFSCFKNLVFLEEEVYESFKADFRQLLVLGPQFYKEYEECVEMLIEDRYIYSKPDAYRIYFRNKKGRRELEIYYIETFIKDTEINRQLRDSLNDDYSLKDDQIRYKILDAILSAKKEILMDVPWISGNAWEKRNRYPLSMKEAIDKALNSHKELRIIIATGYGKDKSSSDSSNRGISNSSSKDNNNETESMVKKLKQEYAAYGDRFRIHSNCVIHDKQLVVDDTCILVGSLNYLSNQGIYDMKHYYDKKQIAGEIMKVNERTENVERGRKDVYERIGKKYTRISRDNQFEEFAR